MSKCILKVKKKKLTLIFLSVLGILLIQSCNLEKVGTLLVCSHPWIVVGFDAESIGTDVGDFEISLYEDRENGIWGIMTGIESFDKISLKYHFRSMKHKYNSNEDSKGYYEKNGVFPLNVFLVEVWNNVGGRETEESIQAKKELHDDVNILYLGTLSCNKSGCDDYLSEYTPKGVKK